MAEKERLQTDAAGRNEIEGIKMNTEEFIERVMKSGKKYAVADNDALNQRQSHARRLCWQYNQVDPMDAKTQNEILGQLFGSMEGPVEIRQNFRCDYGFNIHTHGFVFMNYDCVVLDTAPVHIGDGVLVAPGVFISCAGHALDPEQRAQQVCISAPIVIEDNVWIGAHSTICGGVTIGKGSVIGAGSVVNHDIPANVVAYGVPCRVQRPLTEADRLRPEEIVQLED